MKRDCGRLPTLRQTVRVRVRVRVKVRVKVRVRVREMGVRLEGSV